jgi:hypothetical protein
VSLLLLLLLQLLLLVFPVLYALSNEIAGAPENGTGGHLCQHGLPL